MIGIFLNYNKKTFYSENKRCITNKYEHRKIIIFLKIKNILWLISEKKILINILSELKKK